MNTILAILFLLGALGLCLWATWNVIEISYRLVMITVLGVGYLLLTAWEILVKPVTIIRSILKK